MAHRDIIIIGGGASGMMCAIKAKEKHPDKSVTIIEKQNRIGRKLLSTGNGRCNLYNTDCNNSERYHGSFKDNLQTFFKACSLEKISAEFSKLGLSTEADNEGRVYPFSNHAASVLDVLRFKLDELGVEIICDSKVNSVIKTENGFTVSCDKKYSCSKLVLSSGSPASPKLGSDKSGISLLEKLGHKIISLSPALCPLEVIDKGFMPSLKGIRQKGTASLYDGDEFIKSEAGEVQFTDTSLSGICLFNLSVYANDIKTPIIYLNLNPFKEDYGQLLHMLKLRADSFKNRDISHFLDGLFVNKLGIALMKSAGVKDFYKRVSSLDKNDIENICDTIYNWKFSVKKPNDYNKAQVCSGGVSGDEINPKTMESKLIKDLYICGEAVDIIGDCGGFNLYFAFSCGMIAGESV